MNPRIRELAEQTKAESSIWLGSEPVMTMTYDELEKFAKLIVKECLNQCYYRGMNDELYEGQLKAAAYIEQHFGVEE